MPASQYKLVGDVDADFADCKETRRSTTGFIFLLGLTPITWVSHRQRLVTTSSTEAEYVAAQKLLPASEFRSKVELIVQANWAFLSNLSAASNYYSALAEEEC